MINHLHWHSQINYQLIFAWPTLTATFIVAHKPSLEFLMPRLKHGMIIAFDDYYCWSSTQVSGERKASSEFFQDNEYWALLPFVQYGWGGMSFVVEDRKLEGSATGIVY